MGSEGLSAVELVLLIKASGRVPIVGEVPAVPVGASAGGAESVRQASAAATATATATATSTARATATAELPSLPPDLEKRSVGELKRLMKERGVDASGCVEKGDLVKRLRGEA